MLEDDEDRVAGHASNEDAETDQQQHAGQDNLVVLLRIVSDSLLEDLGNLQ